MILQPNSKLKCQKDNHLDEIDTVCYNQFCTEFRLICFRCLKYGRIHHDHFKDVEKISTLITNIEDKNQECDNFIEELSKYVESVNQTLSSFKMGIRSKCSFQKEQLVNLNSQLINDYLNSSFQLIEKNNQQQQSFQNRLKNQMIYLIIYMENYTYTSFTITKLKYLLQDVYHNLIFIRLMRIQKYYPKNYFIQGNYIILILTL
ncbi:unnamed protein product [Paramecium pentaurelia]|uniref:Uncharacterized protein n=1 Tax=Paramecium pentaurelia TaxID=43138 RepID=A0A8S1YGV4_9CILI|nr:unnamed protein product [Paramecium pentaurelia]